MDDQEIIKDFLIESTENLALLEREIVELERLPGDPKLLASIFRTIHTIKGACGFLAFSNLEAVTHIAESILSQVRNGERDLTPPLASLILQTADAIRRELASIEATSLESGETYVRLRELLTLACNEKDAPPEAPGETLPVSEAGSGEAVPAAPAVKAADALAVSQIAEPDKAKGATAADSTIRVDVNLLDKLMNLVGELVLARNQILQFDSLQDDAVVKATSQRLNLITTQLQEGVMKTRMQPIGVVWNKLPRLVRDLASSCGKQIHLELDGAETELDKSIIEAIKDPLTHIVRNCCDHGIEIPAVRTRGGKPAQGRLKLRAYHEGGQVNIEISDDGGGVNPARVKQKAIEKGLLRPEEAERLTERELIHLVFHPGFSTAEQVTSISGRGVGMDVVKTNIEKIGGAVDLLSRAGEGTTVKIKIPLTLAIIPGLVVGAGGQRFIIPQVSLLELLRLEGEAGRKQIESIHGTPVYRRRGSLLPIARLSQVLALPAQSGGEDVLNIIVLQAEDRQFGLVVDAINDTQEIVVKPLGKQLKALTSYAGATIMGDGKVALILDVAGIGRLSGVLSESRDQPRAEAALDESHREDRQTFLLFRAGRYERLAVPLSAVARLEEFPVSRIERAGGKLVVQYRDSILPLMSLASMLEGGFAAEQPADPAQVIVFADGEHRAGLLVDQILDIHEESIRLVKQSVTPGISGSAVIGGHFADFLDLPELLRTAGETWFASQGAEPALRPTVVLADSNAFSRGLVRNYLELAGHPVVEAVDQQDALGKLERSGAGMIVTSLSLRPGGGAELAGEIRSRFTQARVPVVGLRKTAAEADVPGFDACVDRFDREHLLRELNRLSSAMLAAEPRPGEVLDGRQA